MSVYWRFKGAGRPFRYGWKTHITGKLYRMGFWHGDDCRGVVVDIDEIEVRNA